MFRLHQLPSASGAAPSGPTRHSILLKGIPDRAPDGRGYSVAGIVLSARFDLSTGAASGLTGPQCLEMLQVDISHPRINVHGSGYPLVVGDGLASAGRFSTVFPDDIAASTSNAIRTVDITLLFAPPSADPSDFAVPAVALNDGEIALTVNLPAGTGTVTLNSYTITATALLVPENDVRVPAIINMDVTTRAMDDLLPAGVYSGLVLLPSGTAFGAAANVSAIAIDADGESIIRSVTPQAVISAYAAGIMRGMYGVDYSPVGSSDWTSGYASVGGLPLIFSPAPGVTDGKLSGRVYSRGNLHARISGTAVSVRYYARYYQPAGPADEAQVLSAMGVSPADVVTSPKTLEGKVAPLAAIGSGRSPLVVLPRKVVAAKPTAVGVLGVTRVKTIL